SLGARRVLFGRGAVHQSVGRHRRLSWHHHLHRHGHGEPAYWRPDWSCKLTPATKRRCCPRVSRGQHRFVARTCVAPNEAKIFTSCMLEHVLDALKLRYLEIAKATRRNISMKTLRN